MFQSNVEVVLGDTHRDSHVFVEGIEARGVSGIEVEDIFNGIRKVTVTFTLPNIRSKPPTKNTKENT